MHFFGFFVWDPDRVAFMVPGIHHPITWYGILFAFGFLIGYLICRYLLTEELLRRGKLLKEAKNESALLTDRLTMVTVIGTVLGARLGHVFFYGWPYFQQHPLDIFKIWEGGLASHGAALGILLGLVVFVMWSRRRTSFITFLTVLDAVVIPAAFAGGCIRIGNFINQEILGTPTLLPWGVTFLHPLDGPAGIPLHPVQLYESFFYFSVSGLLFYIWKKSGKVLGNGYLAGWFFVLVFGFRFLIEFLKLPQSQVVNEAASLNMGQWLSLPFILIGIILVIYRRCRLQSLQL